MNSIDGSCDLSQRFGDRRLDIEIIGVGTSYTNSDGLAPLSDHVKIALLCLTGKQVVVESSKKAPWRLVSFDRDACKLIVEPVDP